MMTEDEIKRKIDESIEHIYSIEKQGFMDTYDLQGLIELSHNFMWRSAYETENKKMLVSDPLRLKVEKKEFEGSMERYKHTHTILDFKRPKRS